MRLSAKFRRTLSATAVLMLALPACTRENANSSSEGQEVTQNASENRSSLSGRKFEIIEYCSFGSPRCSSFENSSGEETRALIAQNGKYNYKFDVVITPPQSASLQGAIAYVCTKKHVGEMAAQNLRMQLYKEQREWAFSENGVAVLQRMLIEAGVTSDRFKKCSRDPKRNREIARNSQRLLDKAKMIPPFFEIRGAEQRFLTLEDLRIELAETK